MPDPEIPGTWIVRRVDRVVAHLQRLLGFMGDTSIPNQTGQASVSLPLCWSTNNLPIGIMFSAAFGNDGLLFRLAGQLEKARPWWSHRAPFLAGQT